MSARCRSCSAPIVWVVTTKGAMMPLDAEQVVGGNVRFTGGQRQTKQGGTAPEVAYVTQDALFEDFEPRYVSHFATCPNADAHRRRDQ